MIYIILLIIHFIADFMLQTRKEAVNKYHSMKYLLSHTVKYSFCFFILYQLKLNVIYFVAITFITHTIIDYFTSKLTHYHYKKSLQAKENAQRSDTDYIKERWNKLSEIHEHNFWVFIGFDQLLHAIQLILTYKLLS